MTVPTHHPYSSESVIIISHLKIFRVLYILKKALLLAYSYRWQM